MAKLSRKQRKQQKRVHKNKYPEGGFVGKRQQRRARRHAAKEEIAEETNIPQTNYDNSTEFSERFKTGRPEEDYIQTEPINSSPQTRSVCYDLNKRNYVTPSTKTENLLTA